MKKIVQRCLVFILSLSLIIPNFSIPTYASKQTSNVDLQVLAEGVEEENIDEIWEEVGEDSETVDTKIDVDESNDAILSEEYGDSDSFNEEKLENTNADDILTEESVENEERDIEDDTKEDSVDSLEDDDSFEIDNNEQDKFATEEECENITSTVVENFNQSTEITLSGNDIFEDNLLDSNLIDEKDTTLLVDESDSGTFGASNGFTWTYDESTYTLTVTGEDMGITELLDILPETVRDSMNKVEFKECVVEGTMSRMFLDCSQLTSVDLSGLDTSGVTDMSSMFSGCSSLTSIDLSALNMSGVTDMSSMFSGCSGLTNIDMSGLDISNVLNMSALFESCHNLNNIETPKVMKEGQSIELPYEFWDSDKNIVTEITSVHCNETLTKAEYKIIYNLNGGKNNADNPETYPLSTCDIFLLDPSRTGYTFDGWYSDIDFNQKVTCIVQGSTGDQELYAKWIANKYHIVFNGNGNTSGSMSKLNNCNYDVSYTLTANTFKKTDYTFAGWNTKKDGSGTTYKDKASVKNLSEYNGKTVYLYAQWKETSYTIKYNLNGGTNNKSNPASYTKTTATITLKNPARTGYTFKGWYSDSKCTKQVKTIAKGSTGNKTLYAKWEATKYAIAYHLNGGKNNAKNPAGYTVATANITLQNPSKKGYTFKGWYSDSKCTKQVKNIAKGSTGKKTLYAKWAINKYNITYNLKGGKNHSKNPTSYTVVTANITLQNPSRTGYTFKGWYSDSKCTKQVKTIAKGSTGHKTLYAKWAVNKYNIAFNGNGNSGGSMKTLANCSYGKNYILTANAFKKTGYTFVGWNTKANGTGVAYKNKESINNVVSTNGKTVTLYAQWKANTYTIKFNANNSKATGAMDTMNCTYGKSYNLPTNSYSHPSLDFLGWNTKADGSGTTYKNKASIKNLTETNKKTITLYAIWGIEKQKLGIDVSVWNGDIDWNKVKKSGVSFVIIRTGFRGYTEGGLFEDNRFRQNIQGATNAGLKVGVYFYSQAINEKEAIEEAKMVLNQVKGYKLTFPVFIDVEESGGRADKLTNGERTKVINAFCQTIQKGGLKAGVYANKTWLTEKINVSALSGYKIWLAQYNDKVTYSGRYDMWQYSSKGSVPGISGNVDMNISYLGY